MAIPWLEQDVAIILRPSPLPPKLKLLVLLYLPNGLVITSFGYWCLRATVCPMLLFVNKTVGVPLPSWPACSAPF